MTNTTCPACQCRPTDDFEALFRHAYDWAYIHELMSMDDAEQFAHWFAWRYKDEDEADIPSYRFALSQWRDVEPTVTLPSGDTVRAYRAGDWS